MLSAKPLPARRDRARLISHLSANPQQLAAASAKDQFHLIRRGARKGGSKDPPTHRAAGYWEQTWAVLQLPAGRVAPPPEKRWAPVPGQQPRSIPAPRVNWHGPPPTPSHARRRRRRRRRWGGGRRREPASLGGAAASETSD
ncbi:hypothetical protein PVAP13_9KG034814 [Panicum virgatum]|uniref:Uncharacterized protein n=1 Tax=Panicum virgatum TaxID=38727 RepID=A0A8T0NEI8_PANVG|nr:hypothetical protein PVAP13_9KG034814 [Panicum virgatum]